MALIDAKAEELLRELEKSGALSPDLVTNIRYREVLMDEPLSVQDIIDNVDTGKLRSSDYEVFKGIAEEAGGSVDAYAPAFTSRISDFLFGGSDGDEKWRGEDTGYRPEFVFGRDEKKSEQETQRLNRTDAYRVLQQAGFEVPLTNIKAGSSLEELARNLVERNDVPPDVAQGIIDEVEIIQQQRAIKQDDKEKEIAENEEVDRTNVENPLYAKNLAAYEILNDAAPTKYQFDKETGAIYMTETGKQVDRRGKELAGDDLMGEAGAELVGGWPEGFIPQWEANPEGTAWGKLSVQAGVTVDEYAYNDILDVIENKEWYGADPSRYVAGQESFLGGFGSTYRVKVEETDVMRRTQATADVFGSDYAASRALGSYVWDAMKQDLQDTRRPWYDQNDNWAQFAGLSSENIAAVQSQMVAMGALEPDDIVYGTWGLAEATQMNTIMTIANGNGQEWTDLDGSMLKEFFDGETARTTPSRAAFTPQAFRPMDPARVEMTVRDSVRALVGRDPTDEDLQLLGGYLTDQYSSSYQADVAAGRAQYDAQIAADESGATYGQPGAVEDVDYEARFLQKMDERFEQQTASQERGVLAGKQQDMGVQMSSLMTRLGGGLG